MPVAALSALPATLLPALPLALTTAADAALPFGLTLADLQRWTLIYLALSSLAFVGVWVVGFLRR
jgi:hypothetical protein